MPLAPLAQAASCCAALSEASHAASEGLRGSSPLSPMPGCPKGGPASKKDSARPPVEPPARDCGAAPLHATCQAAPRVLLLRCCLQRRPPAGWRLPGLLCLGRCCLHGYSWQPWVAGPQQGEAPCWCLAAAAQHAERAQRQWAAEGQEQQARQGAALDSGLPGHRVPDAPQLLMSAPKNLRPGGRQHLGLLTDGPESGQCGRLRAEMLRRPCGPD